MELRMDLLKSTILKYGASSGIALLVDYGMFALLLWLNASIMSPRTAPGPVPAWSISL